jgi:hypothetical protein
VGDDVQALISSFSNEPAVRQFTHKELKRQRKERWVVGRRARKAEKEELTERQCAVMDRLVDEWQEVSKKAEEEKERTKDEARSRVKAAAARVEEERQRDERAKRVAHLELLLALRAHRAGSAATHSAELCQYFDSLPRAELTATAVAGSSAPSRPARVPPATPVQRSVEYWESLYHAAEQSVEALLEVRRAWDEHLTREGQHGTCVPPYWLTPPKPSTSWRPWLVYASTAPVKD